MLINCLTQKALITVMLTSGVAACDVNSKVKQPSLKASPIKITPIAKGMSIDELELIIFNRVNEYRRSRNLRTLKVHPRLTELAREHSRRMAKGSVPFSHGGFEDRVKAISSSIPYQGASENVAYNYGYKDPAEYTIVGWINSPGHQKNMVGQYNLTGVGVAKNYKGEYYFTQIFVYSP